MRPGERRRPPGEGARSSSRAHRCGMGIPCLRRSPGCMSRREEKKEKEDDARTTIDDGAGEA